MRTSSSAAASAFATLTLSLALSLSISHLYSPYLSLSLPPSLPPSLHLSRSLSLALSVPVSRSVSHTSVAATARAASASNSISLASAESRPRSAWPIEASNSTSLAVISSSFLPAASTFSGVGVEGFGGSVSVHASLRGLVCVPGGAGTWETPGPNRGLELPALSLSPSRSLTHTLSLTHSRALTHTLALSRSHPLALSLLPPTPPLAAAHGLEDLCQGHTAGWQVHAVWPQIVQKNFVCVSKRFLNKSGGE